MIYSYFKKKSVSVVQMDEAYTHPIISIFRFSVLSSDGMVCRMSVMRLVCHQLLSRQLSTAADTTHNSQARQKTKSHSFNSLSCTLRTKTSPQHGPKGEEDYHYRLRGSRRQFDRHFGTFPACHNNFVCLESYRPLRSNKKLMTGSCCVDGLIGAVR